jgi:hypothetical protein
MQGGANVPAYANQSGEIFGILGNMKDTFQANLEASQKDEAANQKAYEGMDPLTWAVPLTIPHIFVKSIYFVYEAS